jgi:uncharacterized protein (DUF433 family)
MKGPAAPAAGDDTMNTRYQDILTLEPGKRGGKPRIRGMRITGDDVLSYSTEKDIRACRSYAAGRAENTDPAGATGQYR